MKFSKDMSTKVSEEICISMINEKLDKFGLNHLIRLDESHEKYDEQNFVSFQSNHKISDLYLVENFKNGKPLFLRKRKTTPYLEFGRKISEYIENIKSC